MRIDVGAVAERDRQIGRSEEQRVDAGRRGDRLEIVERGAGLDHREGDGEVVGLAQIDLLVGDVGERGGAVRAPAALAERRKFRERREGARIGRAY